MDGGAEEEVAGALGRSQNKFDLQTVADSYPLRVFFSAASALSTGVQDQCTI
jgi:hypothetical protein